MGHERAGNALRQERLTRPRHAGTGILALVIAATCGVGPTGLATAGDPPVVRGRFESVQVNVDDEGRNIPGDLANEPSLAIRATDSNQIAMGFVYQPANDLSLDGNAAYSTDGGRTWTFPRAPAPASLGADPCLASDSDGLLYYTTHTNTQTNLFKSFDGGVTWQGPVQVAPGFNDKPWMTVDRTNGIGAGNVYVLWNRADDPNFTRSTDGGMTFMPPIHRSTDFLLVGTMDVDSQGTVHVVDWTLDVTYSTNAQDPLATPSFHSAQRVNLDGRPSFWAINPPGLDGQPWIVASRSENGCDGYGRFVYLLCSVAPSTGTDPMDVMFARSVTSGQTFAPPVRVNDDPPGTDAWQWFGTMSVAANGRIDAVWNDTRNDPTGTFSELYYSFSLDAGRTWFPNVPASPPFDHRVALYKLGDYYHMVSDNCAANLAYAATFNGEQDVYFLRLTPDCNENGAADEADIALGVSADANGNCTPDECELDTDRDGAIDVCDSDIDNDGYPNAIDECPFAPVSLLPGPDGQPLGDGPRGDCVTNLVDFRRFRERLIQSGPGVTPPLSIVWYDGDGDGDVDLFDFQQFQAAYGMLGQ
ncbi:MAG: thrombospondin type 3 repeat-containing protein [Planctomycetes bacterium]|nr:thrombospondin type 3 repeat-containing protein [Planctomycetota bacterium]